MIKSNFTNEVCARPWLEQKVTVPTGYFSDEKDSLLHTQKHDTQLLQIYYSHKNNFNYSFQLDSAVWNKL